MVLLFDLECDGCGDGEEFDDIKYSDARYVRNNELAISDIMLFPFAWKHQQY